MFDSTQAEYVSLQQAFLSAVGLDAKISAARKLIEFTHQVIDICHVDCIDLAELTLEHMGDLTEPQQHILSKEIEKLRARTIRAEAINKSFGWEPIFTWQEDMEVTPREQLPNSAVAENVVVAFPITPEMSLRLGQG